MELYKYVSVATALKIIESKKLYCAPISSFNDPFEGQVFELHEDFSKAEFIDEVARQFIEMQTDGERVELGDEPHKTPIRMLASLYQQKLLDGVSDDAEFVEHLRGFLMARDLRVGPSEWTQVVHQRLANYLRVLCLSKNPSSLLMWSHYADQHRGAILKFDVSDSTCFLSRAQPINYTSEFPRSNSLRSLAASNLGRVKPADEAAPFLEHVALTKSKEWEYEAEWRVVMRHDEPDKHYKRFILVAGVRPTIPRRCARPCKITLRMFTYIKHQLIRMAFG
jgi:hypothetical protein